MSASKWKIFVCLLLSFLKFSASEEEITAKPGENVTLQCQGSGGADVDTVMLKWIRPDLKSEGSVFYYKDNNIQADLQHPSFHGRVELTDSQMKDRNFSVILKITNINDTGTYECHVGTKGSKPQLINSIKLTVTESGGGVRRSEDGGDKDGGDKDGGGKDGGDKGGRNKDGGNKDGADKHVRDKEEGNKDGQNKDGGDKGGHVGLTVGVTVSVLLVVVVVVVGFIIYKKSKRLNQQNQQPPAVDEHKMQDLNPEPEEKIKESISCISKSKSRKNGGRK